MNPLDSFNPQGTPSRRALRHQIVQRLLKGILLGELAADTRLIANKLAIRFGVSATPIREALVELQQSGVVELLHHRGALVKPFGRKELQDFFAVRGLLEGEAVRLSCGQVDGERLRALRSDLEKVGGNSEDSLEVWVNSYLAVDRRIHLMPLEHCNNKRLIAEIARYESLGESLREIIVANRAGYHESVLPLLEVLAALHENRADAAAKAMGRHISLVGAMAEVSLFDGRPGK